MSEMQPVAEQEKKPQADAAADAVKNATPVAASEKETAPPLDPERFHKPGARTAFHLTNFLGLHMIFNSTTSVFIAYNLLTTKGAQKMIHVLGDSAVGKVAYHIFSAPGKAITSVMKVFGYKEKSQILSEAEKLISRRHSARSSVETAFMCIAGFIALWPVKWLEDNRDKVLNFFDNMLHPGRSAEEKERLALKPGDEPRETWGNLLRARFVALAAVFSVDAIQQNINNMIGYGKGKTNVDTIAWKYGADTYENMNPKARNWLVNFFSRKNVTLSGIQEMTRDHLLDAIDSPPEMHAASKKIGELTKQLELHAGNKAMTDTLSKEIKDISKTLANSSPQMKKEMERVVFAEQARLLFTKELWLTTVMSVVIYTAAKAPFMARFFEKVGLAKKGSHEALQGRKHEAEEAAKAQQQASPETEEKQWTAKIEKKPEQKISPSVSHQEAVLNSAQGQEPAVSI